MKAKKAIKRLGRAEMLLRGVLDEFSGSADGARKLLYSARESIAQAKDAINPQKTSRVEKKGVARATESGNGSRISAAGRKRISEAAKKRWAEAKRKGLNAVSGRRLKKTA